jgi:hypothetical protein
VKVGKREPEDQVVWNLANLFDFGGPNERPDGPAWAYDQRTGFLKPPTDLPPGAHVMCLSCGVMPVHERCDDCPRVSTRLYRELTAPRPSWWRRLFRRSPK